MEQRQLCVKIFTSEKIGGISWQLVVENNFHFGTFWQLTVTAVFSRTRPSTTFFHTRRWTSIKCSHCDIPVLLNSIFLSSVECYNPITSKYVFIAVSELSAPKTKIISNVTFSPLFLPIPLSPPPWQRSNSKDVEVWICLEHECEILTTSKWLFWLKIEVLRMTAIYETLKAHWARLKIWI